LSAVALAPTGVREPRRRSLRVALSDAGIGFTHWLSAGFLLVMIAVAFLAPVLMPYDPLEQDLSRIMHLPDAAHWLGTDDVGRDVLSRIISGARTSLTGALLAGSVALLIGVPIGLIAGSVGGWVDSVLMRIIDAMLAFPAVILAMAIVGSLGPGVETAMLAIGVAYAPRLARLLRVQARSIAGRPFVEAARLSGMRSLGVMVRVILPNSARAVIVQWFVMLSLAFLAEAGLSFLGLGVQPPNASWGGMLVRAYRTMDTAPWQLIAPAAAIVLTVLALNQLGDAINRWMSEGVAE
jgi:peptide/nickel transport system permease protein